MREFRLTADHGQADYLLYVHRKAAGVIEAKPVRFTLTGVERQSEKYGIGPPDDLPAWQRPLPHDLTIVAGHSVRESDSYGTIPVEQCR